MYNEQKKPSVEGFFFAQAINPSKGVMLIKR
ncbi:MAG: hypothetical protein ACI9TY_000136 [Alphaproteobacteria bacterium]|jgi:hypothetical protein